MSVVRYTTYCSIRQRTVAGFDLRPLNVAHSHRKYINFTRYVVYRIVHSGVPQENLLTEFSSNTDITWCNMPRTVRVQYDPVNTFPGKSHLHTTHPRTAKDKQCKYQCKLFTLYRSVYFGNTTDIICHVRHVMYITVLLFLCLHRYAHRTKGKTLTQDIKIIGNFIYG